MLRDVFILSVIIERKQISSYFKLEYRTKKLAILCTIAQIKEFPWEILSIDCRWQSVFNFVNKRIPRLLKRNAEPWENVDYNQSYKMQRHVIQWEPIGDRLGILRIKDRLPSTLANRRTDYEEEALFVQLEQAYSKCLRRDVKLVISDMNAQIGD